MHDEIFNKFNPTQNMRLAHQVARTVARRTLYELIEMARGVHDEIVELPATNEAGEQVSPRANQRLTIDRDELMAAAAALSRTAGLDYYDLVKFKFKFAAVDGARFHSDESWAKRCSHLDAEIVRLQALVDAGQDRI